MSIAQILSMILVASLVSVLPTVVAPSTLSSANAAGSYSITYSPGTYLLNGANQTPQGNGPTSPTEVAEGTCKFTIPENTYIAPDGYRFSHWKKSGSPAVWLPGTEAPKTSFCVEADWALEAIWVGNQYRYDSNKGAGATQSQTYSGIPLIARDNGFTPPAGYVDFEGWCTQEVDYNTDTCLGETIQPDEALTVPIEPEVYLYAIWSQGSGYIYDSNEGAGSIQSQTYSGIPLIARDNGFTAPAGYPGFLGWCSDYDYGANMCNVDVIQPGETLPTPDGIVTLYAFWSIAYSITWDDNGANEDAGSYDGRRTFVTGDSLNYLPIEPAKFGFDFEGWFTARTGGIEVTPEYILDGSENLTFYARWRADIRWNAPQATPSSGGSTFYFTGDAIEIPTTEPQKENYVFAGWFTSETGGQRVNNGFVPPEGFDGNFYAQYISLGSLLSYLELPDSEGLSPEFAEGTFNYTASVPYEDADNVPLHWETKDSESWTDVYLGATGEVEFTGALAVGENVIRIVVTAQNRATTTYTVIVTRAADPSASAISSLSNLILSSDALLAPEFATGTLSYTASVANAVATGFTVTPSTSDSNATTAIYLGETGEVEFTGALAVGENVIRVVVTAQNGATTTYTVIVTREADASVPVNTITWNNQGATRASSGGSTSYVSGSAVTTIPTTAPQKSGHTFAGWFTSATGGRQVTNGIYVPQAPYGSITLFAQWALIRSSGISNWTWTQQGSTTERNWHALASSADGKRLYAASESCGLSACAEGVVDSGGIWTSSDYGVTWSLLANTSNRRWFSIASSFDGTKVAAVDRGGDIWTSADSGAIWTQRSPDGSARYWSAIASSSDGLKLVAVASSGAVASSDSANGFIYTSTDGGATWSSNRANALSGNNHFTGVTSSNDGAHLAATTWASGIYTSSNSGQTWTLRTLPVPNPAGVVRLQAVTSSGDGSRLVTGTRITDEGNNGGIIFTSSDFGASWTAYAQSTRDYINFVSNGDGSQIAASIYGGNGVSTSADYGATWSFQSVLGSRKVPIASNVDGSLLFIGGYGGHLWTGIVPGARLVAVSPSSTAAAIPATSDTPSTSLAFSASGNTGGVRVTPIANPISEASTPFDVAEASIFDIAVTNISGPVTICVDGGRTVRLWHFTNGAWVDITTTQTETQTCGVTTSFSPFATAPPLETPPPTAAPVVVYVPPTQVPYLRTLSAPQIRLSGDKLMCVAGTYNAGYTLDGVIQGSATSLYTPASYTYNLLFNLVSQSLLAVTTAKSSTTWEMSLAPAGTMVSCSVTVTANSVTSTDSSTADTSSVSAALSTKAESTVAAESRYNRAVSDNSKNYQKALVENRPNWRSEVTKNRVAYLAERSRINGLPASKTNNALKSAALKTYIIAQKKITADYKASGPAASAVRDSANKAALNAKNAEIMKANSIYGTYIESIGYGVLIP